MESTRRLTQAFALLLLTGIGSLGSAHADATDAVNFLNVNGASTVTLTFYNGTMTGGNMNDTTIGNVAAGEYHMSLNGSSTVVTGFCTDLWNTITVPETWTASVHQTSAADGLASAQNAPVSYPVGPDNIFAIDYIGENYTSPLVTPAQSAAAQIAVWDLVVGGGITKSGSNYAWSSLFSESGVGMADVYSIEQVALAAKGPSGSLWLEAENGTEIPGNYGRPQDFVIAAPEPSASATVGMTGLFLLGFLGMARKKALKQA